MTLDDDLAKKLREKARHSGVSFKAVVNAVLRRGLLRGEMPKPPQPRFVVEAKAHGFRTAIDPGKLNQLLDDLELEDFNRVHAEKIGR